MSFLSLIFIVILISVHLSTNHPISPRPCLYPHSSLQFCESCIKDEPLEYQDIEIKEESLDSDCVKPNRSVKNVVNIVKEEKEYSTSYGNKFI